VQLPSKNTIMMSPEPIVIWWVCFDIRALWRSALCTVCAVKKLLTHWASECLDV